MTKDEIELLIASVEDRRMHRVARALQELLALRSQVRELQAQLDGLKVSRLPAVEVAAEDAVASAGNVEPGEGADLRQVG